MSVKAVHAQCQWSNSCTCGMPIRWPAGMMVCTAPACSMSRSVSIAASGSSFSCSRTCNQLSTPRMPVCGTFSLLILAHAVLRCASMMSKEGAGSHRGKMLQRHWAPRHGRHEMQAGDHAGETLRVTEGMNGSTRAASSRQRPAQAFSSAPHFCWSSAPPLMSTQGALSCAATVPCVRPQI